ncbi:MAG: HAD-IC family P-type ATPase, partial [Firmicutes bacterium]|nr:HAD-IC family P-type ATPase [Bacillota bacterium]
MKSTLILDGLNCPNCAAKIEDKIRSDSRFSDVEFNFINKELSLTHDLSSEAIIHEIDAIVSAIEDGVTVLSGDEEHGHKHGHEHGHHHEHENGHSHEHGGELNIPQLVARAAVILVLVALYFVFSRQPLFLVSAYIFAGGDVILRAAKNIGRGQIFDENFLMTVATIGAIIIGEYPEALAVMIFYQVGEFFQDMAVEKSTRSIGELLELKIENVNIVRESGIETAAPHDVEPGDILLIKQGEKIPVDGIVIEGTAIVDTSALTGESLPREISEGERILSGCISCGEAVKMRAESKYSNSTAAKIAKMAEQAAAHKAKAETFISAFARIYTPLVVMLALIIAILPCLFTGFDTKWIYRGLVFLVASCPCALVLSVPLCFFSGIGRASKQGVLVKGGNYLQVLSNIKAIAFDKTGTLTTGNFTVSSENEEAMRLAASLEQYSSHPIAKA